MRCICVLIVLTMITNTEVFSQYFRMGKVDEVKEVKKRPVLIMLEEEDPDVVKSLSKKNPKELAVYRAELKRTNELFPQIVAKLWKFNEAPVVKTKAEIMQLLESKNKQYAVLGLQRVEAVLYGEDKTNFTRYDVSSKAIARVAIELIENVRKKDPVFYQNLPNVFPTSGDMALGIQMMQNFLQARLDGKKRNQISDEAEENKSLLSGKTLLIDRKDLKPGTTPAQIKEAYPYPYKIVDYNTIEAAILEQDPNFAVVQIIPMSVGVPANAHLVMSTADGKSLAYYEPIQANVMGKNTEARITQRHLKAYAK
jgi:hypothetical protein